MQSNPNTPRRQVTAGTVLSAGCLIWSFIGFLFVAIPCGILFFLFIVVPFLSALAG